MFSKDHIDISPEMDNLRKRLEKDEKNLESSCHSKLNTLIYYFERFLEEHKEYEKTKKDLFLLNAKLDLLSQGDENAIY